MTRRSPSPAVVRTALPSLAALLSAGAIAGCQSPQCQSSRSGELATHGSQGARDLTHGELSGGLRELGVALGLVTHPSMAVAGAMPAVTHLPPPVAQNTPPTTVETPPDDLNQVTGGAAIPVGPAPVARVETPRHHRTRTR